MIPFLTSMDNISLSSTVLRYSTSKFDLDLWPPKVIWDRKMLYHSKAHHMTSYLISMDTISLSGTVFEIFDFKVFKVWPWPLTPKGHLGSKNVIPFESPHMTSYLTSMDNISLSRTVFEIFDSNFLGFHLDLWPLKVIRGQTISYHSEAHIWLPIWFLYLVPFSRYSTPNF